MTVRFAPAMRWMAAAAAGIAACFVGASRADAQGLRRFAIVAGNDRGGTDTRPLLYARDDARSVHEVFVRLGGVLPGDATLLLNRDASDLLAALDQVQRAMRAAQARGERPTLLVYFSGHAKAGELRMGDTRLALRDLKQRIAASAADVRLVVIDSCRSGAVTRSKGARVAPAFEIESTGPDRAEGTVFLTSSGFDEDSQESDEIAGSFFSHHLVNGLQGEADRSGDGQVTLSEAYAYAYARTVADTSDTAAGAQHPTFSYDLKGHADLVLTAYAFRNEGLYLPADAPAGTYYLVDARRTVSAEVNKALGTDRRVAVRPGRYTVKRRLSNRLRIGEIDVVPGHLVTLNEGALRDTPFEDDPVKGVRAQADTLFHLSVGGTVQAFFDKPTRSDLFPAAALVAAELGMSNFLRRNWVIAADVATGGARGVVDGALPLSFRFTEASVGSSVWREWPLLDGRFVPFFGPRFAFVFMRRRFDDAALPEQTFSTFTPGLTAGARWRFGDRFGVLARARLHYLLYNVDQDRSLGYFEASAAGSYEF